MFRILVSVLLKNSSCNDDTIILGKRHKEFRDAIIYIWSI